nr:MAG TPA: Endothelial cell-specific chemotaxis regulator [Caudoviricetes sp.]
MLSFLLTLIGCLLILIFGVIAFIVFKFFFVIVVIALISWFFHKICG